MININENKKNIEFLLNNAKEISESEKVKKGIERLKQYLEKSDFYNAPFTATRSFSEEGGLAYHSLLTYKRLISLYYEEAYRKTGSKNIDDMRYSIIVCSLCANLYKTDTFVEGTKRVKKNDKWETVPCYNEKDKFLFGKGEKSVYMLMTLGVVLSGDEALAIRYCDTENPQSFPATKVFADNRLALNLYVANMLATYGE